MVYITSIYVYTFLWGRCQVYWSRDSNFFYETIVWKDNRYFIKRELIFSAMHIFQMVNRVHLCLLDFNFDVAAKITTSEFINEGNRMLPVNSFCDCIHRGDSMKIISRLGRTACLFRVFSPRKSSQRYNTKKKNKYRTYWMTISNFPENGPSS